MKNQIRNREICIIIIPFKKVKNSLIFIDPYIIFKKLFNTDISYMPFHFMQMMFKKKFGNYYLFIIILGI